MQNTFDILKKNRQYILQLIDTYGFEQLNSVPKNFANSIIWNIGHLLVTEKTLTYGLSNLEIPLVSAEVVETFRKGTFPADYSVKQWEEIRTVFVQSVEQTEQDYRKGLFAEFKPYTTSIGVYLADIETTIRYILYHEGIHTGVIQSIRKQF